MKSLLFLLIVGIYVILIMGLRESKKIADESPAAPPTTDYFQNVANQGSNQ